MLLKNQEDMLGRAFARAFYLSGEPHCSPRFKAPSITLSDETDFSAVLKSQGGRSTLSVSSGLMRKLGSFWEAIGSENSCNVHRSLVWLVLHEMQHIKLRHITIFDNFGVSTRAKLKCHGLSSRAQPLIRLCLELQADHDAAAMLLGSYSDNGWVKLRTNAMAICAMMVLIELEEAQLDYEEKTHPNAATRIFQLLCHIAEMPLISAHLHHDPILLPPADEIERYGKEVTLPCYFDAVHLAEVAGAESIKADLGNPEDFFADMAIVKLDDPSRYCYLKTEGAKELAQLWGCNEALKPLQKGVHFAN